MNFIRDIWEKGKPKGWGLTLLSGLQDFHPELKSHLQRSWRLLRAWDHQEPAEYRRTWPKELLMAVMVFCFSDDLLDVALYLAILFVCSLRPIEGVVSTPLTLKLPEVVALMVKVGVVIIEHPKTA